MGLTETPKLLLLLLLLLPRLSRSGIFFSDPSPNERDYVALAKGFPALALMSESDLEDDFGPFAAALKGALDPIVADFRRQMVRALDLASFIGD